MSGGYVPPAAPPPAGPGAYGYAGAAAAAVPSTSTNAIVAFVLSIASWVVCPLVCAIIALVFASSAKKEIQSSNGWKTGDGFVTAAKIISWVNIGFSIVFGILWALLVGFAIWSTPSGTYSTDISTFLGIF